VSATFKFGISLSCFEICRTPSAMCRSASSRCRSCIARSTMQCKPNRTHLSGRKGPLDELYSLWANGRPGTGACWSFQAKSDQRQSPKRQPPVCLRPGRSFQAIQGPLCAKASGPVEATEIDAAISTAVILTATASYNGAPDTIRTCGLRLRRATLYPAELRVLTAYVVLTRISRMSELQRAVLASLCTTILFLPHFSHQPA
jgi:hypothetical protein